MLNINNNSKFIESFNKKFHDNKFFLKAALIPSLIIDSTILIIFALTGGDEQFHIKDLLLGMISIPFMITVFNIIVLWVIKIWVDILNPRTRRLTIVALIITIIFECLKYMAK